MQGIGAARHWRRSLLGRSSPASLERQDSQLAPPSAVRIVRNFPSTGSLTPNPTLLPGAEWMQL